MTYETNPELITKALAGDRLAAERLVERHRRPTLTLAYRTLGNADDAQDVAQETLVYAIQRLPELRDVEQFNGWLRSVTLSLCADYRRRRGTRRLGDPLTVLNEASEEKDFAERFLVRRAVRQLSEAHRTTLLLHYIGGWSRQEVAGILGIPLDTVRSRLMAAKRHLRTDLDALFPSASPAKGQAMLAAHTTEGLQTLSETHTAMLYSAFPGAQILSVHEDSEPWMPFTPRVRLALKDGTEKTVDFRGDITPAQAQLLPILDRLNIPGPRLIHDPVSSGPWFLSLCEPPRGENLLLWALGGTPHRIRLATERAFQAIDRLQSATEALLTDPLGSQLPRRTLSEEVAILTTDEKWNADSWLAEAGHSRTEWLRDPWFAAALARVEAAVADIHEPLVYTNYLFFFPLSYRIQASEKSFDEPLGWPGDVRYEENPLVEFVSPFGHIGDPLLGLAMVWVQDCYPFVHTGYVEQFLWRRGITRREFAPRLALKALQMVARDLPVERPDVNGYWDALHGWVEQGLEWM